VEAALAALALSPEAAESRLEFVHLGELDLEECGLAGAAVLAEGATVGVGRKWRFAAEAHLAPLRERRQRAHLGRHLGFCQRVRAS